MKTLIAIWLATEYSVQMSLINNDCEISNIGDTLVFGIPEADQVSRVCNASYSNINELEDYVSRIGDTPYSIRNVSRIG